MKTILVGSFCIMVMCLFPFAIQAGHYPELGALPVAADGGYSIFDETMVDMNWLDVEKAGQRGATILLSVAVIEEHGPALPLGVDTYASYLRSKLIRRELMSRGVETLIAPPMYWGINQVTSAFPGSFDIKPATVKAIIYDIFNSLHNWGFNKIFVFPSHGDRLHNVTVWEAIRDANNALGTNGYYLGSACSARRYGLNGTEPFAVLSACPPSSGPPPVCQAVHAEAGETGFMAYFYPQITNEKLAKTLPCPCITAEQLAIWRLGGEFARQITPLGYLGCPSDFDEHSSMISTSNGAIATADLIESVLDGTYTPPPVP